MAKRIFISYRREDAGSAAQLLFDRLAKRYGRGRVFMDQAQIKPGAEFPDAIRSGLISCDVLLALIGKSWVKSCNTDGGRRIDDPKDFVQSEIATALAKKKLVIPVLINGAEIPRKDELPQTIAALAERQSLELSYARTDFDVKRLIAAIDGPLPWVPRIAAWSAVVLLAVTTAISISIRSESGSSTLIQPPQANPDPDPKDKPRHAQKYFDQGQRADDRIDYANAYAFYAKARSLQPENPRYLDAVIRAAIRLNKFQDLDVLMDLRKKMPQHSWQDIAAELDIEGMIFAAKGQHEDALKRYTESVKLKRKHKPEAIDESIAESYENLAAEKYSVGRLTESRKDLETALEIESHFGTNTPQVATIKNNLGGVYEAQGENKQAEENYVEALKIRRGLNKDSPEVETALNNLAELYRKTKNYDAAEKLFEECHELQISKPWTATATSTAITLSNYGLLELERGDYTHSENLLKDGLEIFKNNGLPLDYPPFAHAFEAYVALLKATGRSEQASKLMVPKR